MYAEKLGFWVWKTDIGAQKIDSVTLVTHEIVVANFFLKNKYDRNRFFEKTLLVAYTSIKVVLDMTFFFLFNTDIRFVKRKLE